MAFSVKEIPLEQLRPAEWNANVVLELKKIRASIEDLGVVENLVVRPHPDGERYEVLSGNQRLGVYRPREQSRRR